MSPMVYFWFFFIESLYEFEVGDHPFHVDVTITWDDPTIGMVDDDGVALREILQGVGALVYFGITLCHSVLSFISVSLEEDGTMGYFGSHTKRYA